MNEVNSLVEASALGRFPIRLMKSRAVLFGNADAEGFVRNPSEILRKENIDNPSQAIKKLAEFNEIQICEHTGGLRPRVTLLKVLRKGSPASEKDRISEEVSVELKPLPATESSRHHSFVVSDRSWKEKQTGIERMFELLNIRAREQGTYPLIHDPLYVFQMNGILHHALDLGALERQGRVEVTRGGGTNGREPCVIKLLPSGEKPSLQKKSKLIKHHHIDGPGTTRSEADSGQGVQRVHSSNRTLALVDFENIIIGMDEENQRLDPQRFKNTCVNYGSNVGMRCFVSEGTYHMLENTISALLPFFPIVLTANGTNAVDTIILEEVHTAVRHNLADTFLLVTRDGGKAYENLVKEARAHGKNVELMAITKGVSHALANHVGQGHIIDGAQHDPKESHFKGLIRSLARAQTLDLKVRDIVFISTIVRVLASSMDADNPPLFMDMYHCLWNALDGSTKAAYRMIDCRYVLESLISISRTVFYRSELFMREGKSKMRKRYYLDRNNPLARLCLA